MNEKIASVIHTVTLLIPWTILLVRRNSWALQAPAAGLIIGGYILFILAAAGFCVWSYCGRGFRGGWMKLCLIGHGIYGVFCVCAVGMMLV